jgi:phosphoribosylformimino-5-aminoimidazole carboxamide ribotide isomerase
VLIRRDPRFFVVPAVDLLGDEAVRLRHGDYGAVVSRHDDPLALIATYAGAGASLVHLVDLDGARDGRTRPELVRDAALAAAPARIQASGGIRSPSDAEELLDAGAARVVVGTAAFAAPGALATFAAALGDRLVVAVDVRNGFVAVDGWLKTTSLAVDDALGRCRTAGVSRVLCTAIDRDGTLEGPDLVLLERASRHDDLAVLAAGGVRSTEDLKAIAEAGCEGAVVGRALLEGRLPLDVLLGEERNLRR